VEKQMYKVLSPIEKRGGGHYWMRLGSAFRNKDNSINVYLDAIPKGLDWKFTLRELDEEDLRKREAYGGGGGTSTTLGLGVGGTASAATDPVPF
jgi:hypothetical protein